MSCRCLPGIGIAGRRDYPVDYADQLLEPFRARRQREADTEATMSPEKPGYDEELLAIEAALDWRPFEGSPSKAVTRSASISR